MCVGIYAFLQALMCVWQAQEKAEGHDRERCTECSKSSKRKNMIESGAQNAGLRKHKSSNRHKPLRASPAVQRFQNMCWGRDDSRPLQHCNIIIPKEEQPKTSTEESRFWIQVEAWEVVSKF